MKINKLTKNQNLRWESSRMMLPEHTEKIISHNSRKELIDKPILDEQKWMEINDLLTIAIEDYVPVYLSIYHLGNVIEKKCYINKFNPITKNLSVILDTDTEEISIKNIVDVRMA
ncbi:YolD-like family protein [Siminovitchia sp. 179-K 8D1 HS]|uniref:YolD-like family protein n=1 Tax=Siminovitchia sp. 179-K 8D1 HS TaxID=3142385 RepID=UPI00399FF167